VELLKYKRTGRKSGKKRGKRRETEGRWRPPIRTTGQEKGAATNGQSIGVALNQYHQIALAHVIEEKRGARRKRRS
jgi:hypothetical protein